MKIIQQDAEEWWLLVSVLVLTKLATVTTMNPASSQTCPAADAILPCRCTSIGDEVQIWCSYSGLTSVMEAIKTLGSRLQYQVDEMILESNNLPSLPGRTFEGLDITRLMLRDNGLERVTSNWLATLENSLLELFIIEPRLRTLPNDALEHLRRLEAVTLQGGIMKRAPRFSSLHKLRYIQMHSPVLMELAPENFEDLPSLEQFHVIGSPLLNKLDAGFLKNLHKLNLLNISNCGLSWMHPKSLVNLPTVRELVLTWNRLSDAGIVGRACRDLHNLQVLRLDNNFIDRIMESSFVDLPSLRELYLSGNMISEISRGAFRNTPSLKVLDLNKNLLRRINPAAFIYPSGASLEEIWMTDNHLYHANEMRSLFSSLHRLRFLDMSKNYLEEIPFDPVRGHPTLERLHLDENKIKRIPRKAFSGMPSLRELRLRNNSLTDFLDGPSWNLPSLKGLDLSQNTITRVDARLMTYLPSLRRLDLSENHIETVLPDSFTGNLELETLNLSKNFITSFHALTFSHLPKLFEIDAGWNRLREMIPGLPRNLEHLRLNKNQIFNIQNNLDLPSLRLLDMSGNYLQTIPQDSFRSMSRLQWLHLNDNSLENIHSDALDGLSRLELLNIRNNRIRELNHNWLKGLKGLKEINLQGNFLEVLHSDVVKYSPKLEVLHLGNNKLSEIKPGAFSNARELQELNLSYNSLNRLPEAMQGLQMLQVLDISHNSIRSIQPFSFDTLPSLTELRISNNRLYELPSNTFKDLQKLEYLDLNNNELEVISSGAFRSLPSLIAIRLSVNRLTKLPEETFIDLPELQSTELQANKLQEISDNAFVNVPHLSFMNLSSNQIFGLEQAGIRELRSLEVLDLSNNKVSWLEGRSFLGMEWLVELKMDNNAICNIHGAPFNGLTRLRVLSLKHNRMTTVTENAFHRLRNNIAVLDIDGNPLSCSCKMLWLQTWLKDTSAEGPRCADGSLFREARLSRTDCASSRIVEPIVPGCESEFVQGPVVETSQLSSLVASKNGSQGPLPHESEYFYDEYVEYQYEEMNGTEAANNDTNGQNKSDIITAEKSSPHLVTGDTPTIYARPVPAAINFTNPGLGFNDLKKAQQQQQNQQQQTPPYNGLTFFGIPLPSLSFGNLWKKNAGRSAEEIQGRNVLPRAKVQPVSKRFETSHHNFVTPAVEVGGFVPVMTGSNGLPMPEDSPLVPEISQTERVTVPPYEFETQSPEPTKPNFIIRPKNLGKVEAVTLKKPEVVEEPVVVTTPKPYVSKVFTNTEVILHADKELLNFPLEASENRPEFFSTYPRVWSDTELYQNSIPDDENFTTSSASVPEVVLNEVPEVEPIFIEPKFTGPNNWYFQDYNKTNLQPFVGNNGAAVKSAWQILLVSSSAMLYRCSVHLIS